MDFTRGTRPVARGQIRPPAYDDYQPSVEWSQDAENHLLRVDLPDFKREEIKVQLDKSGKLTVKGTRQMGEHRYMRLDQAFQVPKDTIVEKINGRFEEGRLFLVLPKKIKGEAPAPSQEKRDELSQREKPKSEEVEKKKEEEPTKREKPKSSEDGVKRGEKPKSSEDGVKREEKPKSSEDGKKKEEEATQKDKPKGSEDEMKKEEKPTEVEKPKSGEDEKRKEEETTHKEKPRSSEEEKKEEEPIYTQKPKNGEEKKEREATQREKREKGEEEKKEESWYKSMVEDDYNVEMVINKAAARKKSRKDADGWLSYGLVDDLLEKINRKRCVIVVAVVAFSVGFYVSRKLKSSGR